MKSLTKVVYQPDRDSSNEYVVLVNPDEFRKWRDGDTTIPLVDVVDSFQVLWSNQGNQGILSTPSRQQLENDFGTHVDSEVITQMLKKGKEQSGKAPTTGQVATNVTKGSYTVDTRGKTLTGIGSGLSGGR